MGGGGTVIRYRSLVASPWANGQGRTVEVWRRPVSGAFDVRLSIATVDRASRFSSLPGVDRVLMPLSAGGLSLHIDGADVAVGRFEAVAFPGEAGVTSDDAEAPGHDLNLMVRRGAGVPALSAVVVDGDCTLERPGLLAVVVVDGAIRVGRDILAFGDTILADGRGIRVAGSGMVVAACVGVAA